MCSIYIKSLRGFTLNHKIKRMAMQGVGILLSASTALGAEGNNTIVGNLGEFSGIAGDGLSLTKWVAFLSAILSILIIWTVGNWARVSNKINHAMQSREHLKGWAIDAVCVIVGLIFLFKYAIPAINEYI
jgi:hypothetical protein